MFCIPIPKDEYDLLFTDGVDVRINGEPQTLFLRVIKGEKCLVWSDETGENVKPILQAVETEMEVKDRHGLHPCISFTCGAYQGQRWESDGPIMYAIDDAEEIDFHIGGE